MKSVSAREPDFSLRSLLVPVYLPTTLFAIGQGATIPIIPLVAVDLGASVAIAGAVVGLRGLGTLIFDVPVGKLVARVGEKVATAFAGVALALIAGGIATRPPLPMFAALTFLMGGAWSVWSIARLAHVTEATPKHLRGRALSLMAGMSRIGNFVGPLIGGLLVASWGLIAPFLVQAVFAIAASVAIAFRVNGSKEVVGHPLPHAERPPSILKVIRTHRHTLGTAGFVGLVISALRSTRQVIIPLWGNHIGLTGGAISLVFGLSTAIETALFYPIGMLMDRRGRRSVAMPCLIVLATGLMLIPTARTLAGLVVVGVVLGLGNGLGAGIIMTLGSDLAPAVGRAQFFGVWRFTTDLGMAGGPLLVAAVTSILSLGTAAIVAGIFGFAGAAVMWMAVPETLRPDRG